jgi:hypothetical protein
MGRHEPPNDRSFYLSLGASTLRFLIIIALVVGGIVVIDQAFPAADTGEGDTAPLDGGVGVTGVTGETEPTGPTSETRQEPERSPQVTGVRIAVFNGAGASGLAADTQTLLEEEHKYDAVQAPADAPAPYPVTTIYYRAPKDEIEAEYLAGSVFEELEDVEIARLEPGTANIDRSAQLAIFLGDDYAALTAE